jgi:hypothetical protein
MMKKISKETALQLGLTRYFTGVPCKNGHICEHCIRADHSSACVQCMREHTQRAMRKLRERDPERVRLRNRLEKQRQRERDPEKIRRQWREWYARQKAKQTRRAAAEMENGPIS